MIQLRFAIVLVALLAWFPSLPAWGGQDLGRFDRQVDGIGSCRSVAIWTPRPGEEPVVMFVDQQGSLVGGPQALEASGGIRDLAVSDEGVVVVGGESGISVFDRGLRPGWTGWWSPPMEMPVGAVSIGSDPVRVVAIGARGTSEDGTIVAFDPHPDTGGESWRRPHAYPGARGVVVLPDGSSWIADTDRHRLVKLDSSGEEIRAVGDRGAFPGLFNMPVDLAVHGDRLYVADQLNHRVSVHRVTDGAFLSQWGMHAVVPREGDGRIHYPEGVAISPDGEEIVVLEPFERRYQVFGRLRDGDEASGRGLPQRRGVESHFGTDIAAAGDWLAMWEPEGGAVVVFDTSYGIPLHLSTFSNAGPPPAGVGRLASIAIDGERSEVWLVDAGHRRISRWILDPERPGELVFDPFMGRFARGWAYESLERAIVADGAGDRRIELVDAEVVDGELHLLDTVGPSIIVADRGLALQRRIPLPAGLRPVQFTRRPGDRAGWVVTEPDAGRIWLVDENGEAAERSLAAAGIDRPFGVAAHEEGFAVSDRGLDRVVMFDGDFQPVSTAGETGAWDGGLWRPAGLAVLPGGAVAVVDQGNHRAQAFDPHTGDWRISFSLGQGHDTKQLLKEDFLSPPAGGESTEETP